MSWSPSKKFCAQMAHLFAACSILLAGVGHGWKGWIILVVLALASAFKEFVADLTFLEHDTLIGSATDFTFYQAGGLIGLVTILNFWCGIVLALIAVFALTVADMM